MIEYAIETKILIKTQESRAKNQEQRIKSKESRAKNQERNYNSSIIFMIEFTEFPRLKGIL